MKAVKLSDCLYYIFLFGLYFYIKEYTENMYIRIV